MTEDVMRTRKRVPSTGSDRSREGEPKRWASPRKKQRTKYVSTEGSDTSDSNSDSVDENEETSEEMLPRWPHWDVTCGTKTGILHVENLERGQEDCIESEGRWFSPSGFEEFGGKGTHKKWKNSIIYKNQPLNFWIDRCYLKSPPNKRCTFTASKVRLLHCDDTYLLETLLCYFILLFSHQSIKRVTLKVKDSLYPFHIHRHLHLRVTYCLQNMFLWVLLESEDKNNNKEEVGPDEQPVETSEDQTDGQNGEQKSDVAIDIVSTVSQRKPLLILRRLEHLQGDFHLLLNDVVLLQNGSGSMSTETQSKEKVDPSKDESPEAAETSEPQEETLSHCSDTQNEEQDEVEHMPIEDTVIFQDQGVDTISLQEVIIENIKNEVEMVAPISQINLESVEEDTTPPNVIIEYSAQLTERPPQEENPSALIDEPPETAQTDSEVDIMDLEQLKKEKIKWQIKVLKLQEVYYSLQIQKLKQ